MKKLIAIISGVSMAALVGGVSLADEKDKSEKSEGDKVQAHEPSHVIQQQGRVILDSDWNEGNGDEDGDEGKTIGHVDHGKTTVGGVADSDDDVQVNKNPERLGVNISKAKKKEVATPVDDDEEDGASRMKGDFSRNSTRPTEKSKDMDDIEGGPLVGRVSDNDGQGIYGPEISLKSNDPKKEEKEKDDDG